MPRQIKFNRTDILDIAFDMAKNDGIQELTARHLANRAECSTQPIFRAFHNMSEVIEEVFQKAIAYYSKFYDSYPKKSNVPFVDLGMAYIHFAKKEKQLFTLLFLSDYRGNRSLYELLNGEKNAVGAEFLNAKNSGCKDPGTVFMKMWIFIHGAACMVITGDYDLTEEETEKLLAEHYESCVLK